MGDHVVLPPQQLVTTPLESVVTVVNGLKLPLAMAQVQVATLPELEKEPGGQNAHCLSVVAVHACVVYWKKAAHSLEQVWQTVEPGTETKVSAPQAPHIVSTRLGDTPLCAYPASHTQVLFVASHVQDSANMQSSARANGRINANASTK